MIFLPLHKKFSQQLIMLGASLAGLVLAGCGSNSGSQGRATPISVASVSGAATSTTTLPVGASIQLRMTPAGDKINAGVDWTVICGGNPVSGSVTGGACGTFAPAHTADGAATVYTAPSVVPVNASIVIRATSTANPSQGSDASFSIVPTAIAVLVTATPGPLPVSLGLNATVQLQVTVSNDPTGAGVIMTATCGSSACGSFNPTTTTQNTTYTSPSAVPADGKVTITATSLTDTTKTASATVAIATSPPPQGLAVSIVPPTVNVTTTGASRRASLTAIVSNDAAAAGVDWTVACAANSCGSVSPAHTASGLAATYTAPPSAPPNGSVTITAASTSNPAITTKATANIVPAAPIAVTITAPPPATVPTTTAVTLTATVSGDANNLGIDWMASCGTSGLCGTFSPSPAHTADGASITYTAPALIPDGGGVVVITATSSAASATTPANPAVAITTIVAPAPAITLTQVLPATVTGEAQVLLSATVTNDTTPGGVLWSVPACGSTVPGGCGYITPAQTASGSVAIYTAPPVPPPGGTVTVTATSVANPSTSASTNAVISPNTTLSVGFVPSLPAQLQPGAVVNLTAAVAHDASSSGVDWHVCASNCGFFTIRPAIAAIPATATTPYVPPVAAVTATSVSGWSNGLPIVYTAPIQPPQTGTVTVVASAHADSSAANSGVIAINPATTGAALPGVVRSGLQPVAGASVALFAAGSSGYGSASSQIASTTTDKQGSFTVPAGYSCPSPASQMYVVATGGTVGSGSANGALSLMTALGSCSNLSSTAVFVNEITTIASAYAVAPFAANDELTGNSSALYIGTSSTNQPGLANAFASVHNLVDISTGRIRYATPAGNAAVPYVLINTLADALSACTSTSGGVEGDGSTCSTLFTATDTLSHSPLYNAIAPVDTLQAAFNLAQRPTNNYGYKADVLSVFSLATPASPFQPVVPATPGLDASLSLHYTTGGGLSAASTVGSFAEDATGNLWITDTTAGTVIEWNTVGAAVSPSSGYPAGGGPLAIDASGNVWTSDDGKLHELTNLGTAAPGSPFKGIAGGGSDMAFDALSNLWIANGAGVNEFSNLGVAISPAAGFTNNGVSGITALVVDSADNVWLGGQSAGIFAELTNPGGNLIAASSVNAGGLVLPGIAADSSGDLWANSGTSICEVKPYAGQGSQIIPSCKTDNGGDLNTSNPAGLAFDGSGTLWAASQGGGLNTLNEVLPPSILPINPALLANNSPNYLVSPSLSAGPLRVAVDGSGNLWVLLADQSVTEYVGVATPVVTPIALALQNQKLAAKP